MNQVYSMFYNCKANNGGAIYCTSIRSLEGTISLTKGETLGMSTGENID